MQSRITFIGFPGWPAVLSLLVAAFNALLGPAAAAEPRPNILFCIADDWGWPDAGAYGEAAIQTPAFDRVAREGVLFDSAFVTSPSCTPSRNSILTGQWHWRLGAGANLWSSLDPVHPVYPLLLENAGYHVGHSSKAWGPGDWRALGRRRDPAGRAASGGFTAFLASRPAGKPFCFWLGSHDPHRPYDAGSGSAAGIDPARLRVPADLPDCDVVRRDLADYLGEVQRFDAEVAAEFAALDEAGEAENTIVVITGDHGMPFPRHKCHLYDSGTHVPLAIRWPAVIRPGRQVTDFVSLADLAPSFLEAAGEPVPAVMTGASLMPLLRAAGSGQIDPTRDHVLTGRERHTPAQEAPSMGGYPMRAIRTVDWLYIRNFEPERWPSGCPEGSSQGWRFADCDDSPTKQLLMAQRHDPAIRPFFDLAFAKRPPEELYDLANDPEQIVNVAADPTRAEVKADLASRLVAELEATADPRVLDRGSELEGHPYFGQTTGLRPTSQPSTTPTATSPADEGSGTAATPAAAGAAGK
jgi:N-sulfoglucosamine sulfohydrolase